MDRTIDLGGKTMAIVLNAVILGLVIWQLWKVSHAGAWGNQVLGFWFMGVAFGDILTYRLGQIRDLSENGRVNPVPLLLFAGFFAIIWLGLLLGGNVAGSSSALGMAAPFVYEMIGRAKRVRWGSLGVLLAFMIIPGLTERFYYLAAIGLGLYYAANFYHVAVQNQPAQATK